MNLAISVLIMTPFLAKNLLSTGYLIYPMASTHVLQRSYTPLPALVKAEADYIKAYARDTNTGRAKEDIERVVKMPWHKWIPVWWSQTEWAGRILFITFFLGVGWMINRFLAKEKSTPDHIVYFFVTLVGFSFWIILAPSVRFGSAFLMAPLVFCIAQKDSDEKTLEESTSNRSRWLQILITLLILALLAYSTYRLIYFMDGQAVWLPKGPIR